MPIPDQNRPSWGDPEHSLPAAAQVERMQIRSARWVEAASIDAREFSGLNSILDFAHGCSIGPTDYRIPHLKSLPSFKPLLNSIRNRIEEPELGSALLDFGSDFKGDSNSQGKAMLLLHMIGSSLGQTVTIDPGRNALFFKISNDPQAITANYAGDGRGNHRPGVHTDGSAISDRLVDLLILLCVEPAQTGGASYLVDGEKVLQAMPEELKEYLRNRSFFRQNPFDPENTNLIKRPAIVKSDGPYFKGEGFAYHRSQIERGHKIKNEPLSSEDQRALDSLDQYLNDLNFRVEVKLRSGQALIFRNSDRLHDREAFEGATGHYRHLERYWVGRML